MVTGTLVLILLDLVFSRHRESLVQLVVPYSGRIAIKFIFAETNFVDCMIKATPTQVSLACCS